MSTAIPANRARFTVEEALVATGGRLVQRGSAAVGVSTDSRSVGAGEAFVALVGERFDGHEHAGAAIARGATMIVASRALAAPAGVTVVVVDDTTRALGLLARAHRRRWAARAAGQRPRVLAITGSAGKTTTRRAVSALLDGLGARVHATAGNLNNAVGVPMVLLGLEPEHDLAVIEIGTSSRGEIAYGAAIAEPDLAILTLVAAAHSERIGSLEDIAAEKGALLEALGPHGIAIVNADDPWCSAAALRSRASRWIGYGASPGADVRIDARTPMGLTGSRLRLSLHGPARRGSPSLPEAPASLDVSAPLLGAAGAYAVAAAVAAACSLRPHELSSARTTAGLARLAEPEPGRLAPRELADGTIVIDDTYNANRASMIAGIEAAAELARALDRRLVLVLGEMRELGALSAGEHDEVGRAAVGVAPALVVAVTGDARRIADAARAGGIEAAFARDADEAAGALKGRLAPGDLLLVKGSRSIGLDRVVRSVVSARGG
jgi:UDP-N-acetylmuramoyl-tripeptide--D-alanyl-D-alanine ligase